jgi:hypothetical protein
LIPLTLPKFPFLQITLIILPLHWRIHHWKQSETDQSIRRILVWQMFLISISNTSHYPLKTKNTLILWCHLLD